MQINNVQSLGFGSIKGEHVLPSLKTFSKLYDMAYYEHSKIIMGDEFNLSKVQEIGKHKDVILKKDSYYYADAPKTEHSREISVERFSDELMLHYQACILRIKELVSKAPKISLAERCPGIIEFPDPSM